MNHPSSKRTKRLTIAFGLLLGFMLGTNVTSSAHTASTHIPKVWEADPYYYVGNIDSPLNGLAAKTSIHAGADPWIANSGTWLDFINSGYQDESVHWTGAACTTGSGTAVWILTESISSLGSEITCATSTLITRSIFLLDDTRSDWYVKSSSTVPSDKYDLRFVIVHEFGHAGGFAMHWEGDGEEDCTGSDRETMCSGLPKGTSYKRSIEEHEDHTFDSAY